VIDCRRSPLAMTQLLNLCFLGGRMAQVTTFGSVGAFAAKPPFT